MKPDTAVHHGSEKWYLAHMAHKVIIQIAVCIIARIVSCCAPKKVQRLRKQDNMHRSKSRSGRQGALERYIVADLRRVFCDAHAWDCLDSQAVSHGILERDAVFEHKCVTFDADAQDHRRLMSFLC
jgi:hypothetical protein